MKRVHVHIDRLVLRGVPGGDQAALVEALNEELRQRFADPGVLEAVTTGGNRKRLQADKLRITPQQSVQRTGRQLARSIVRGFRS